MDFYKINIDGIDYILKFTFNSAKYLDEFEVSQDFEKYPMKVFKMLSNLFYGAMNWANDKKYTHEECDMLLEKYLESDDSNPSDFLTSLFELLQESNFFKKLLKTEEIPKVESKSKQKPKK